MAELPVEDMTADQLEIRKISEKWSEVRLLGRDEVGDLDSEWQEAHQRYFEKYDKDMEFMQDVATKLQKMIEPPKVQKKSKGQKRRDAWAKKQALASARAAAARK